MPKPIRWAWFTTANYLIWMEVARDGSCASRSGFRYKDMEADGILLAVTESHCRYLSPARYDDEIAIATSLGEANRRFVTFDYEMTCEGRQDGQRADAAYLSEPGFSADAADRPLCAFVRAELRLRPTS